MSELIYSSHEKKIQEIYQPGGFESLFGIKDINKLITEGLF